MDKRDEGCGRAIQLPLTGQAVEFGQRERTLRTLQRVADTLGRPISDFLKAEANGGTIARRADREIEK